MAFKFVSLKTNAPFFILYRVLRFAILLMDFEVYERVEWDFLEALHLKY